MTIEQKVAATLLQKPTEVKVGNNTYKVAPPSTATLILVSAAVSRLPQRKLDSSRIVEETLTIAEDCDVLGEIAAILILGAKRLDETHTTSCKVKCSHLWGVIRYTRTKHVTEPLKDHIAREILQELSPAELHNLVAHLLQGLNLSDFFALTTFLTEVNLAKATRKVETSATALGQS